MLNVQRFIKDNGLQALSDAPLNISINEYPNGLVVLNYSQIDSPKHDPIVKECRGLILEKDTWNVVACSFDRFFNYGECPHTKSFDIADGKIFDKIDGSLLTAYNYKGEWNVATRKMAFAEGTSAFGNTFRSVFDKAFDLTKLANFSPDQNFVFELVSPETRIVTPYTTYEVYLLTVRDRVTGEEIVSSGVDYIAKLLGVKRPQGYSMNSFNDMIDFIKKNKSAMDEGFVCLWEPPVDNPQGKFHRIKVKNPSYLAIAHMRDNGVLSEKRVLDLVVAGDEEEYLGYFPEDRAVFQPYVDAFKRVVEAVHSLWAETKDIQDQKEFAMKVKDTPIASILFGLRKGTAVDELFGKLSDSAKERVVKAFIA